MGKKTGFTEDWLKAKGLVETEKNVFAPKNTVVLGGGQEVTVRDFTIPKQPVIKTPDFVYSGPLESYIQIDGIVAGLNGNKGLMRAHWSHIARQKELYQMIIRDHLKANKARKHTGEVVVNYVGYKSSLMDWDNFCASFKHIGDSLVKEGIIIDDSPKVVVQFLPQQIKSKRAEQKVIIIIKDLA